MWDKLAHLIIRYRFVFLGLILAFVAVMGYFGKGVETSYDYLKVLPEKDEDFVFYKKFKKQFKPRSARTSQIMPIH